MLCASLSISLSGFISIESPLTPPQKKRIKSNLRRHMKSKLDYISNVVQSATAWSVWAIDISRSFVAAAAAFTSGFLCSLFASLVQSSAGGIKRILLTWPFQGS